MEYSKLPAEESSESTKSDKQLDEWPVSAEIVAKDISLRYATDGPVILKNLNFTIENREKVKMQISWLCFFTVEILSISGIILIVFD